MTKDDIARMAQECTAPEWWDEGMDRFHMGMDFLAFAEKVAAVEREECAKLCERLETEYWREYKGSNPANRYNPRTEGLSDGAGECAAAIRARGQA